MQISLAWLAEFVDMPELSALVERLTNAGIEVEDVIDPRTLSSDIVVGLVRECIQHPKADQLKCCTVFDGQDEFNIVCGAPNVAADQKVVLARIGATLPDGMKISARKLRGQVSQGMLCGRSELGLEDNSPGIWVLNDDVSVGQSVVDALGLQPRLNLGITPNRPDLLSHFGVAREIAAVFDSKLRSVTPRVSEMGPSVDSLLQVEINAPDVCPRYFGRVIENVQVGPSPMWLVEALAAIGQRSVNNIVDATNYVMFDLGQPLHAFDLQRLQHEQNQAILKVRYAVDGESLQTLDGVERTLQPEDLVIADAKQPVALAGIMGGLGSQVHDQSTSIVLECAFFVSSQIRQACKRHGMRSESSHRFERGGDINGLQRAIDRAAQLIVELSGGRVCQGSVQAGLKKIEQPQLTLRLAQVERLLGMPMSAETIVHLLEPLEIRCTQKHQDILHFAIPTFRPDLTSEVDILEEIARRYGYDNFVETLPSSGGAFSGAQQTDQVTLLKNRASEALLTMGLHEVVNFGFGRPDDYIHTHDAAEKTVKIINPLGEDLSVLRTYLLPGLLRVAQYNARHGHRDLRIFEAGTCFRRPTPDEVNSDNPYDANLPREDLVIGWLMRGRRWREAWFDSASQIDMSDMLGSLEAVIQSLRCAPEVVKTAKAFAELNAYASVSLEINGESIGRAGQVHPDLLERFELDGPIFAAQINLTRLTQIPQSVAQYRRLPKYPGTRRDVAVVADNQIQAEALRHFIQEHAAGSLGQEVVGDVRLFDVYTGAPMQDNQRSLAFAIQYCHPERTLTDTEVNSAFQSMLSDLKVEFGVDIR